MSRLIKCLFFLGILSGLQGQSLQFDASFENGRLDTAYLSANAYRLWPITNLHARVSGLQGQQPLFAIYDSLGYQLRSYHHMGSVTKPLIISP